MKLKFIEPKIENFSYSNNPDDNEESHGLFILSGLEDKIKLWALSGVNAYDELIKHFNIEESVLGGGKIAVDHFIYPILVYSYSREHGALPNKVLRNYFNYHGFDPKLHMVESEIKKETKRWFRDYRLD